MAIYERACLPRRLPADLTLPNAEEGTARRTALEVERLKISLLITWLA